MWAAICGHAAIALTTTSPGMDSPEYATMLEEVLVPCTAAFFGEQEPFDFVQDNASIHTARHTMRWLAQRPWIRTMDWPACSPDLNPIENVWGRMIYTWEPRRERTKAELFTHVQEEWAAIERNVGFLRRLAHSMPTRLRAVIDNHGGPTKY